MDFILLIVIIAAFIFSLIYWGERILIKSILTPYDYSSFSVLNNSTADSTEQHFSLTDDEGNMIKCTYIPHDENGHAIEKAVILLGGCDSLRNKIKDYSSLFIPYGIDVISVDAPESCDNNFFRFGVAEQSEIKPIIRWIKNLSPDAEIGLFGVSYGAAEALYYSENNQDISFVISDSSYADLSAYFKERVRNEYRIKQFPLLTFAKLIIKKKGFDIKKASPLKMLEKSEKETPVFFIHGEADSYFLPQMSIDLYNAKSKGYKKFWLAPEAEHIQAVNNSFDEYQTKTEEFLLKIGFIKGKEDK